MLEVLAIAADGVLEGVVGLAVAAATAISTALEAAPDPIVAGASWVLALGLVIAVTACQKPDPAATLKDRAAAYSRESPGYGLESGSSVNTISLSSS